jgi:hypothetical protein
MSRRTWLFIGVVFGLAIPILLNLLQRIGPWHMRPSTYFLFRPGLLLLVPVYYSLQRFLDSPPFLGLLIVVLNAAVFGAAAYGLRKGFLALITVLMVLSYVSLPPSDAKLERQFAASKPDFERLIQKASQTPSVVRIGNAEIQDRNGRKYRQYDRQVPLSAESWRGYREIFGKTGMKNGLYRTETGQVQFMGHTIFGKIGPIGTLCGYVYCPAESRTLDGGFLPCREEKVEDDIGDYRYKRIAPEWFIVEIFETRSVINYCP